MQGGAVISVNSGTAFLDFMQSSVSSVANWSPNIDFSYPVLTTGATISWTPFVRQVVTIGVNILNSDYGSQPISFSTSASVNFNAAFIETDGGQCTAGELMMTSSATRSSNIKFSGKDLQSLAPSDSVTGQTKCFDVPNDNPTMDEVTSLSSVGAAYCTSLLSYTPRTTYLYTESTITTPNSIIVTSPTTISTTLTVYPTITITPVVTQYTTVNPTSYIYTEGTTYLSDIYLRRRGLDIASPTTLQTMAAPEPTIPPQVNKRAVDEPALIQAWDATKISKACSQIVTQTITTTLYTGTATAYSGLTTSTAYSTINVFGGAVTSITITRSVRSTSASTIYSGTTVTTTVPSSCPLQSEVACFTITGHGAAQIEDKQVYFESSANPLPWPIFGNYGTDWSTLGIFYLTCAGNLVSLPTMQVLRGPPYGSQVTFDPWGSPYGIAPEVCTQDTANKVLSCGSGWLVRNAASVAANIIQPVQNWLPVTGGNAQVYTPIMLTYDEVTCPCY